MSGVIDWASGWKSASQTIPSIKDIELNGTFRNAQLNTKLLRVEVESNGILCEKSIPLKSGMNLGYLYEDLKQHYRDKPFSIVQDLIDNAWDE